MRLYTALPNTQYNLDLYDQVKNRAAQRVPLIQKRQQEEREKRSRKAHRETL
jgi:hypothetical protein